MGRGDQVKSILLLTHTVCAELTACTNMTQGCALECTEQTPASDGRAAIIPKFLTFPLDSLNLYYFCSNFMFIVWLHLNIMSKHRKTAF